MSAATHPGVLSGQGVLFVLLPLLPAVYRVFKLLQENPTTIERTTYCHEDGAVYPECVKFREQVGASLVLSVLGYMLTRSTIPKFMPFLLKRGLMGKDLCKKGIEGGDIPVPEATGVVPATVFLVCIIILQLFYGQSAEKMIDYHSALLSICFMIFLGFTDDVLDLPWRYKLILPTIATLPILCAYDGSTAVVVPTPLQWLLYNGAEGAPTVLGSALSQVFSLLTPLQGEAGAVLVDLGWLYLLYMGLLAIFCTNAVNIYAGINGLEAGQSFVIGCAILYHNVTELSLHHGVEEHLFSAMLIIPFLGCTMGMLHYNWYPARAFVGDTYCYFAGMTFAVVGIHGHFSKTLLLLFIPQVLNFLLSIPQLFKYVPCPRHRLPRINPKTKLLEPSSFDCDKLQMFRSPQVPGQIINLTLINLVLKVVGPMTERNLCLTLLAVQVAACAFGFWIRYEFAPLVYSA